MRCYQGQEGVTRGSRGGHAKECVFSGFVEPRAYYAVRTSQHLRRKPYIVTKTRGQKGVRGRGSEDFEGGQRKKVRGRGSEEGSPKR
eukprot:721044-Prorocentrum_minimum.AAC.1